MRVNAPTGDLGPERPPLPARANEHDVVARPSAGNDNPQPGDADAGVVIRRLTEADLPRAMALKDAAGWNQTPADWRGYLEFEPAGCFAAEQAGEVIGTATSIRYGERFGWIGMVLVDPKRRRLGLGTRLLRHTIASLQAAGVQTVRLDATPMGRAVYLPLGFKDEYEVTRFEGVMPLGETARHPGVRSLSAAEVERVAAWDAPVFGAERRRVIAALRERAPQWCFVFERGGELGGYLIARPGQNAVQLGPWVAADRESAEALWGAFAARIGGQKVFLDVPQRNIAGATLLRHAGFTVQRGFVRMHLGPNSHPGQPERVFGTGAAEKG